MLIERLKELYQQHRYGDPFKRCEHCRYFKSYHSDWDADSWCGNDKFDDEYKALHQEICYEFSPCE